MEMNARQAVIMAEVARRGAALRRVAVQRGRVLGADAAAIKARAAVPGACGPEIVAAPARGALLRVPVIEMRPVGKDGFEAQHVGFQGRDAARAVDVWDRIEAAARMRGADAPFSPAQVGVAREYAALVERHASSGMRGFSVEARVDGGGRGEGYADAVIAEGLRIAALREAVGRERAKLARGVLVAEWALVDWVALGGKMPGAVLQRCGVAAKGETRERLRAVLARALDRMALAGAAPRKKGD